MSFLHSGIFLLVVLVMAYIVLVHHGCSSGLLGPHLPKIHYTLPRFILKDPGLQLLENPQKKVVVRNIMINPKINHEMLMTPPQDLSFRYHWDSVSRRHKTSKFSMLHTKTHQPFNFNVQEKNTFFIPDPPQLTYPPISSGTRFAYWQDLPGGRPFQYSITLVHC